MPHCDKEFFQYLLTLDCSRTKVLAMPEGSVSILFVNFFYLFIYIFIYLLINLYIC
jgi:hypothetical protein